MIINYLFFIKMKEKDFLINVDAILGKVINTIPPPSYKSTENVFHDLMSCIIEQQIHYRSSKNIFSNLLQKAEITTELNLENFEQFDKQALSTIKLSTRKYETVLNVLEFWQNNAIDWQKLEDKEVREKLSQIKGIGKWTINMILLFTLQRSNIFAYDDFHIKQIMINLYGLNPKSKLKSQMKKVTEKWLPYQSTAFLYLSEWKKFNQSKK